MKQTLKTTVAALGLGLASVFLAGASHAEPAATRADAQMAKVAPAETKASRHNVSATDRAAIADIVESHVWALSNKRSALLPDQVSQRFQRRFRDPKALMAYLVKTHAPVAQASEYRLGELKFVGKTPVQTGFLTDRKNQMWKVAYVMMRDGKGKWRISSGFIAQVPGFLT
ncbi:MAG: DUF4864 domain-containing protein [Pseudomonadota bacterium]